MSVVTHPTSRHIARPGVAALALTAALGTVVLTPVTAHADNSTTLTVVGTSDVSDSNLMAAVIKPGFEAAYPGITLNYVPLGTGAAITYAEAGNASALLVHAASLENQFVDQGFSEEQYGRAIFYGDYVLLGPASDPAGVMTGTNPATDIVTAFEKIATAGAGGTANFVSRGGTPGTTVEEHAIWALTNGVSTCDVSQTNGGGTSPSTATGACSSPIPYPSWYHATGLGQGPNVDNAGVCNYSGSPAGGNCYTLTDRGTFQYLKASNDAGLGTLKIVSHNNDASARGGSTLLVNSFHAYAINPNAHFTGGATPTLNLDGAEDLLNWITSPAAQKAVGAFEADTPDGAPFLPDAAPQLAVSTPPPALVTAGNRVKVKGSLSNVVPGTPALAGVQVNLQAKTASATSTVASTTTTATGNFSLSYKPTATAKLTVSVPQISQVEIVFPGSPPPPVFGDLLTPTSATFPKVGLGGTATLAKPSATKGGKVTLQGDLGPKVAAGAKLRIYANQVTSKKTTAHTVVAHKALPTGATHYKVTVKLKPGKTWIIRVGYINHGLVRLGTSSPRTLVV